MSGERDELWIGGEGAARPRAWTFDELRALPEREQVADVGTLVRGRKGSAVRLSALLERSAPREGARFVDVASQDPAFAVSVPFGEVAREAVVVYALDGRPLAVESGGPFRLLVPGHPDECVNVKRVARIELALARGKDTRPADDAEHAKLHAKKR